MMNNRWATCQGRLDIIDLADLVAMAKEKANDNRESNFRFVDLMYKLDVDHVTLVSLLETIHSSDEYVVECFKEVTPLTFKEVLDYIARDKRVLTKISVRLTRIRR